MLDLKELCLRAVQNYNFSYAAPLDVRSIQLLPEVREMCSANRCGMYGKNWSCPPAIGSLEALQEQLKQYSSGIILQTVGFLEDDFDYETIVATENLQKLNFKRLYHDIKVEYPGCLPMPTGACSICSVCTYPDQACRFPDQAYPPLEAYGIFVSKLCEHNNISYYYGPRTMAFVSAILF